MQVYFSYLHYNLIDRGCLTTFTMTIDRDVIYHHKDNIHIEAYVMIENFGIKHKHASEFQNDNMSCTILV